MIHPEDYFIPADFEFPDLFEEVDLVWEILPRIKSFIPDRFFAKLGINLG